MSEPAIAPAPFDDDALELVTPDLDGLPVGLYRDESAAGDPEQNSLGGDATPAGGPRGAVPAGDVQARLVGFVARKDWGARAPRQVSTNVRPDRGGVAIHYGGPAVTIRSHGDCPKVVRAWQDYHMDTHGWSDLAYSGVVCPHGYFFAGRGYGVRTAAQGTNDGNDRFLAICWLNGSVEPTQEALEAIAWGVLTFRKAGAGSSTLPHRSFHSTDCPGDALAAYTTRHWDGRVIVPAPYGPVDPPVTLSQRRMVRFVQGAVHVGIDGKWGDGTDKAVTAVRRLRAGHPDTATIKAAQRAVGVADDGAWGPASAAAWTWAVKRLQIAFRYKDSTLVDDGDWGTRTESAYVATRSAAYGKL